MIALTERHMDMLGEIFERNPDVHFQAVYDLKIGMGLTWPKLAEKCYDLFGIEKTAETEDWDYQWRATDPQIIGAALCNLTASAREEDFLSPKWL